jgi:hypothetical protein
LFSITPFQGLDGIHAPTNRALPYPDDYKAFSLNLTAMGSTTALLFFYKKNHKKSFSNSKILYVCSSIIGNFLGGK